MANIDLYGDDARRLREAYQNSLGRSAGDDELSGWLGGSYGGGGIDDWTRQIAGSHEAQQRTAPRTVGPQPGESGPMPADGATRDPMGWFAPLLPGYTGADLPGGQGWQPYGSWKPPAPSTTPVAPPTPTAGGMPPGGFQGWFQSLTNGKPVTPQTLRDLAPQLAQYGIKLGPNNARGFTDGIILPDGSFVDVIMGATETGGTGWGWLQGGGHSTTGAPGNAAPAINSQYSDAWTKLLEQMMSQRIGNLGQPAYDPMRQQYMDAMAKRTQALGEAEPQYAKLLSQLEGRVNDLKGPGYTGAENEVIRTGALDPIEQDRTAAKKRVMERLSARGLTPDSGVAQQALLEVDKAFDGMRGTTQTTLTTNDLNRREDRAQRADTLQGQLVDIPQMRSREQLDTFSAMQALEGLIQQENDARSREAIGYAGAGADLGPQRLQLAMQAAGMGGSPDSMFGNLMNLAGLNQNNAAYLNQQGSSMWSGLGSIAAILARGGR